MNNIELKTILNRVKVEDNMKWIKDTEHFLFFGNSGSRLYKLHGENSDFDFKAIVFEPKELRFGLDTFESYRFIEGENNMNSAGDIDIEFMTLRTFLNNVLHGEFLCIEPFFTDKSELYLNKIVMILEEHKDMFLSMKMVMRYLGYTKQLTHKLSPKNPQKPEILERIDRYGYDTKNAMHLFRVLLNCINLMDEGTLKNVLPLEERQFLLDTKTGLLTKEEVVSLKDEYVSKIESKIEKKDYILRDKVDSKGIKELFWTLQKLHFDLDKNF